MHLRAAVVFHIYTREILIHYVMAGLSCLFPIDGTRSDRAVSITIL